MYKRIILIGIIIVFSFMIYVGITSKDWNLITAWGTIVGVIIAFYAFRSESERSRFAMGIDIMQRLEERFSSMKEERRKTAECIKNRKFEDPGEVIEFFTTVGILLKEGDFAERIKRIAWRMFFYWLHGYYTLLKKDYIDKSMKADKTSYESLIYLYEELSRIEHLEKGKTKNVFDSDKFIRDEINLTK